MIVATSFCEWNNFNCDGDAFPSSRLYSCVEYECDVGTKSARSSMGWFGQTLLGDFAGGIYSHIINRAHANHWVSLTFNCCPVLLMVKQIELKSTEIKKRLKKKIGNFLDCAFAVVDVLVLVVVALSHLIKSMTHVVALPLASFWS